MLDAFLEVVSGHTKQAEARRRQEVLLERLPTEVLQKIASGCLPKQAGDDGCWLDKFRGTPLLDQAIAIEKEELDLQMAEADRRRQEGELQATLPTWQETDLQRSELSIKRKLLELELAGADVSDDAGGQEGEDAAPPDLEAAEAAAMPPVPKAEAPIVAGGKAEGAEEAPPETASAEEEAAPPKGPPAAAKAEGEGADSGGAASEEKPKPKPPTTKVTKETTEKPAEEKIDIKAAAARMRMAIAVKEAQPANRAGAFRRV